MKKGKAGGLAQIPYMPTLTVSEGCFATLSEGHACAFSGWVGLLRSLLAKRQGKEVGLPA